MGLGGKVRTLSTLVKRFWFKPETTPIPHPLTSLPKDILYLIAHKLSFIDLCLFSTVNRQAAKRLFQGQDYWRSRAYVIKGELPEFNRAMYLTKCCRFQKITYDQGQITIEDIPSNFRRVSYTRTEIATIDFENTLHVETRPELLRFTTEDNLHGYSMANVESIICRDYSIIIQTRDKKLYVSGVDLFTKSNQFVVRASPSLILENVTKVNIGPEDAIIWKDGQIYQTNHWQNHVGPYLSNTIFEPLSGNISAKEIIPFDFRDIVFLTEKGHLYVHKVFDRKPRFISANVKKIYAHRKFVYWINDDGELWQNDFKRNVKIMEKVCKLSCSKKYLWVLSLESKLYLIQSNSDQIDLNNITLVSDDVESCLDFVVVKKIK